MSKHRRFVDGAGFTRHCWECSNATDWDGEELDRLRELGIEVGTSCDPC